MSGGSAKNSSESWSKQNLYGPQAKVLDSMYGKAGGIYDTLQGQLGDIGSGIMDWNKSIQDTALPQWQQQLQGGQYGNLGFNAGEMLGGSIEGAMGGSTMEQQALDNAGVNNYADAYRGSMMNDARSTMDTMLGATDARAAASGMSGGSRHGVAQGQGMQGINRDLQRNLSEFGYNDYTQNLNRQMQAGRNADMNLMQQQGMLSGLLGGQNAAQQQALASGGQMQNLGLGGYDAAMMPVNAYGQMMNAIGAPVVLSDSYTKSSGSSAQGGI